jgi:hypothetical protein
MIEMNAMLFLGSIDVGSSFAGPALLLTGLGVMYLARPVTDRE